MERRNGEQKEERMKRKTERESQQRVYLENREERMQVCALPLI